MEKEPIKVTKEELAQFILDQPDSKKVDFSQTQKGDDCGCLMVQYGEHRGFDYKAVGIFGWYDENDLLVAEIIDIEFNHFGMSEEYAYLKPKARKVLGS